MALVDLVKITATTTGTGAITFGSAVPGYRGREVLTDGEVYSYSIQQEADYEFGRGTYLAASRTFVRSPLASSNGGLAINLQANANISLVALAEDLLAGGGTGLPQVANALGTSTTLAPSQRAVGLGLGTKLDVSLLAASTGIGLIGSLAGQVMTAQTSSVFPGDGSTALYGGLLQITGASASQNEIGWSVSIDNAKPTGGGKAYVVADFNIVTSRAGSCTGYAGNDVFRSYGPPGVGREVNVDNFGADVGNLASQNSLFGPYNWIAAINVVVAGTNNILAGIVVSSPPGYSKRINRGLLFDGDCVRLNDIETTTNADTSYMMTGTKNVGFNMVGATITSQRALWLATGHYLWWNVGGTPQAVIGVSGTNLQIGYGTTQTLFGSSLIPGGDNVGISVGTDAARVSKFVGIEFKGLIHTLVATTAPNTPPSGQCYTWLDATTGKLSVKNAAGQTVTLN